MPTQAERFADNWAYLKTELQWLDRVLMLAVARQRQETKEVDRLSQSRADRVTSHWWKGIMSFKEDIAYDEHRPQAPSQSSGKSNQGYQQQLETRIQLSREQGVLLGLPSLRDRLDLNLFEKNLVLLGLALKSIAATLRFIAICKGMTPTQKPICQRLTWCCGCCVATM
ncbi:MAG: hypothetical protein HC833_19010 [Leptolyngbyaceae cyanobacterium RM1_406_9]|nr:hypothetical protein [Leptolyngbyaceae cyanobacterium RM1_406_9]